MEQLELNILGRLDGPRAVAFEELAKAGTYRDACIACWTHRRVKNMTASTLAEITGMRPSHISDYFSANPLDKHGHERREMPAKYIPALERIAGNTFITQWQAAQTWSAETMSEMLSATRRAA